MPMKRALPLALNSAHRRNRCVHSFDPGCRIPRRAPAARPRNRCPGAEAIRRCSWRCAPGKIELVHSVAAALGGQNHLLALSRERLPQPIFRESQSVVRRGIEEINPIFDRHVNGANRFMGIDFAKHVAQRRGSKSQERNKQARASELAILHHLVARDALHHLPRDTIESDVAQRKANYACRSRAEYAQISEKTRIVEFQDRRAAWQKRVPTAAGLLYTTQLALFQCKLPSRQQTRHLSAGAPGCWMPRPNRDSGLQTRGGDVSWDLTRRRFLAALSGLMASDRPETRAGDWHGRQPPEGEADADI